MFFIYIVSQFSDSTDIQWSYLDPIYEFICSLVISSEARAGKAIEVRHNFIVMNKFEWGVQTCSRSWSKSDNSTKLGPEPIRQVCPLVSDRLRGSNPTFLSNHKLVQPPIGSDSFRRKVPGSCSPFSCRFAPRWSVGFRWPDGESGEFEAQFVPPFLSTVR